MLVLDLFSGIGGMALGLGQAGMTSAAFVELDPYCRSVLARHWPGAPLFDDIRRFDPEPFRGRVDLVAGGPPCQAASVAGKRRGHEDDRWLWGEYLRVVRIVRPRWLLAENVPGLVSLRPLGLDWIIEELEAEGYACETVIAGAYDAGAPHERKRVWIVAHAADRGRKGVQAAPEESRSADAERDARQLPRGPRGLRGGDVADSERDALRVLEQRVPGGRPGGVRDEGEAVARESGEMAEPSREARRRGHATEAGRDGYGSRLRSEDQLADADGGRCRSGGESESGGLESSPRDESLRRCLRRAGAAPQWPAGRFERQHEWEPARVIAKPTAALVSLFDEEEIGALPDGALLNPAWVEALMGFPIGWTKTHCGTRNDRLRALGNAVVPPLVRAIGAAIIESAGSQA